MNGCRPGKHAVRVSYTGAILCWLFCCVGCTAPRLTSPERLRHGLIIILPGIEGRGYLNQNIAAGLAEAGIPDAIEIYDWTLGPVAALYNLADYRRNISQADRVVDRIVDYQKRHPTRPVHLIGHSGGAGLAVLALERLPEGRSVTAAILLGAALWPEHDLTAALRHTRFGIYNFYSPYDAGLLGIGTSVAGTIDRRHGPAAGLVGFRLPKGAGDEVKRIYEEKLHQIPWSSEMASAGHFGGHFGWASRQFVKRWIGPIIRSHRLGRVARF